MKYKLGDVCEVLTKTVNPQKNSEKIYNLYSLPSFDNNKKFEKTKGKTINSNKIIIKGKLILFNKLNLRFKRIWNVNIDNEISICSTEFIPLKANPKLIDNDYLYYLLLTDELNESLIKSSTGTSNSHQRISKDLLLEKEIFLPKINEQRRIAEILKIIDKKIEYNMHTNNNLYEISKQLYKRWFIDYEFPNENGKPYKLSGGKMIDSEIGEIPENWKVKQLDELVNVINGYSYKGKELVEESNIGMATIKNFDRTGGFKLDGYKPLNPEKIKEQQIVELFDLVVAHTDLTQNADIIGNPILILNKKNYEKIVISMDLVKVDPKNENFNKFFIFETLNSDRFKNHALGYVSGTTVLHLDKSCIKQYSIAIPENVDKVKDISQTIKANYEKISELVAENQILQQLRDTLLPKLMNGEIGLDKIEI